MKTRTEKAAFGNSSILIGACNAERLFCMLSTCVIVSGESKRVFFSSNLVVKRC